MDPLTPAVWTLLLAPLAGAGLLASRIPRVPGRRTAAALTIGVLAVTLLALVVTVVAGGVFGTPVRRPIGLGPIDPSEPVAAVAWSLAPVLIALLFIAISLRAASRVLIALATMQAGVAMIAAGEELLPTLAGPPAAGTEGSALVLDPLAGLLLAVSAGVGGLIVLYALGYEPVHLAHRGLPATQAPLFVAWLLLFLASMHLLVLADDLRLLTVGWELTTLCSFALIGFDRDQAAIAAARRALAYNVAGGVALGVAAALAGPGASLSGILGATTGGAVGQIAGTPVIVPLALAAFILAAATKAALVPFHPWLLGAMVAAAPVSALLHASTMVKAGTYLLLRLSPAIALEGMLGPALALLGGLTFAAAALLALREHDLKRVLALSTVSSLGLIAAAAGLGTPAALAAGVLLLAFHAVAKALAFLTVGAIEQLSETRDLEVLVGVARRSPGLGSLLLLAAAALTLPPFGLVVAKWAILVLGATDLALVVLLALGGAAGLALWTGVASRLLVRRTDVPGPAMAGSLPLREGAVLATLGVLTASGFALAAPVASAVADPAATVAFGRESGLAAGWSIALAGAGFAVPLVVLLVVLAAAIALVVARRVPAIAPQPYLSGANLTKGPSTAFHGALGKPTIATSGGFYWSAAWSGGRGGTGPTMIDGILGAGWMAVALIVAAAVLVALNATPGAAP